MSAFSEIHMKRHPYSIRTEAIRQRKENEEEKKKSPKPVIIRPVLPIM